MIIWVLWVLLVLAVAMYQSHQTLLKYDPQYNNRQQPLSLEQLTERSIYQVFAFVSPTDACVTAASNQDSGPVGAYARLILQLRQKFHQSPLLQAQLKHIFERPDQPPLSEAMAVAQDRLYTNVMMLTPPGSARDALIRYAVYRRQGVPLDQLQRDMSSDADFRAVMKDGSQPFLMNSKFGRVLQAFEQDMIDAAVKAARAIGATELEHDYTRLAFAQLDAQISLYQQQQPMLNFQNTVNQQQQYQQPAYRPPVVNL